MKTSAIIFVVCLVGAVCALDAAEKTKSNKHIDPCVAETGLDPAKLKDVKPGQTEEVDGTVACYVTCMIKRIGYVHANGTLNEAVFRSMIPPNDPQMEQIEIFINKCKKVTGINDCDKGYKIFNCFQEKYFLPGFF